VILIKIWRLIWHNSNRLRIIVLLAVVGIIAVTVYFGPFSMELFTQKERLRDWVASFGLFAPAVFISLQVIQITIAPIPGQFVDFTGGYLFGLWGVPLSLSGVALGSALAIALGRLWGRPLIIKVAPPHLVARIDHLAAINSAFTWFMIYLLPMSDAINYIAGLTTCPIHRLVLAAVFGRSLSIITMNLVGASIISLPTQTVIIMGVVLFILFALIYPLKNRIQNWAWRIVDSFKPHNLSDRG